MALYRWQGVTAEGTRVAGWRAATVPEGLRTALTRQGVVAFEARPLRLGRAPARRPSVARLARLTRHLATLLAAGVPLLQACRLAARQGPSDAAAAALGEVARAVESGSPVAEAFARQPHCFPPLVGAMLAAGEASGGLAESMQRIADGFERQARVRTQLVRAALYPTVILAVGIAATGLLLVFVVPAFEQSYAAFGAVLPLPTRLVLVASRACAAGLPLALALAVVTALLLRRAWRRPSGRLWLDRRLLRLPIAGGLLRSAAAARLSAALAALLASGVPIVAGLRSSAPLAGNRVLEAAVLAAAARVAAGGSLATALAAAAELPPFLGELAAIGEQTGALDEMLARAASHFESELERTLGTLTAALEPAAVLFLGVTLGGVVLAMYLPVFQLGTLL